EANNINRSEARETRTQDIPVQETPEKYSSQQLKAYKDQKNSTEANNINRSEARESRTQDITVQETPEKYSSQQLKAYKDQKKDLISKILKFLEKDPINFEAVKENLKSLKTLRDSYDFGNDDIPDSKGCMLAQGSEEKDILSAIC